MILLIALVPAVVVILIAVGTKSKSQNNSCSFDSCRTWHIYRQSGLHRARRCCGCPGLLACNVIFREHHQTGGTPSRFSNGPTHTKRQGIGFRVIVTSGRNCSFRGFWLLVFEPRQP